MIFTLAFIAGVHAITCKPYTCDFYDEIKDKEICYRMNDDKSKIILKECVGRYSTCTSPDKWDESDQKCEDWYNIRRWASESLKEYIEYTYLIEDQTCVPNDLSEICNPNDSLVCHCQKGTICNCIKGKSEGEACSKGEPCKSGYVCNLEVCVLMYSMNPGDVITDSNACPVGTRIIQRLNEQICGLKNKTYGSLPKKCQENSDCTGDDGSTTVPCICGINYGGESFCSLQAGDPDNATWKEAVRDRNWDSEVYYEFLVTYYPYIQGDLPECLTNVWKDFGEFSKGDPDMASVMGISLLLSLIIL